MDIFLIILLIIIILMILYKIYTSYYIQNFDIEVITTEKPAPSFYNNDPRIRKYNLYNF